MKYIYSKSCMVVQFTSWYLTLGGIERSNLGHWAVYHRQCIIIRQRSCQAERPLVYNFVLYFGMNLARDGTNQLPKAGFDWIALMVIFQGRKGLTLPRFSNFDTYCPFIQNLFSNVSSILAWTSPGWWQQTVMRRIWLNHSKGHCQG